MLLAWLTGLRALLQWSFCLPPVLRQTLARHASAATNCFVELETMPCVTPRRRRVVSGAVLAPAAGLGLPSGDYPVVSSASVVDLLPLNTFRHPHTAALALGATSTAVFATSVRSLSLRFRNLPETEQ